MANYDTEKIRIMAKMAVYDKRDFERDSKTGQYFRHDYIYKKNMQMRFFLGIGCAVLLLFYVIYLLAIEGADVFAMDFQTEAIRLLFFGLALMAGYSFIGTIIYTREFLKSERRVNAYFALMRKLDPDVIQDDYEPVVKKEKPKFRKKHQNYDDMTEDDYEEHVPYTHYDRANLEYHYRSSDDPEFWEDDDESNIRRR
ncbi:MAG: hypothetical protein FWE34_03110 [Defluviitaleaceae bacterium]|nr:hypothetical protein [Defluviitaleaceae bacterium]